MLIKPEGIQDDQRPIEFVKYFNRKDGSFPYWERLDTSRVEQDSFTYISGALYKNRLNSKVKIQLTIDEDRKPMPQLDSITTYAQKETAKAFARQLKKVYKTGRRNDIPYYLWHRNKVESFIESNSGSFEVVSEQSGIPTCSGNKGNPLHTQLMTNAFVTIVMLREKDTDICVLGCTVSIGRFSKNYFFETADHSLLTKKLAKGQKAPDLIFSDYREDLYE
ncbi:hypothetical protein ACUALS_18710 [Vibrio sp. NH-7]